MLSSIEVREARGDDMAAVAAIYARHVLTGVASFETEAPDEAEMLARWLRVAGRGWPYLVAVRDGKLLGYAYATQFRDRPAYVWTAETSIYLDLDCLRQGIGRLLLDALVEACRGYGFRQLVAVIGDSGNAGSIGLHAALGFTHAGLLSDVGHKFGRDLDVVFMQRTLGTDAA